MSSSKKLANYLIRALRGDLAQFRGWKMKIWPQIQAKMALTQFSPIAGYYHGVLAATDMNSKAGFSLYYPPLLTRRRDKDRVRLAHAVHG